MSDIFPPNSTAGLGREGEFEVSETCRSTSLERWATGVDRIAAARWVQAERLLRPKTGRAGRRECAGAAPTSVRPGRIVVRASVIPLFSTVARRRDHAAKTDRCYWVMPPSRCWAFVIGDPEQCRCLFPSLFDQREHGRTKPVIAHAAVESLAVRVVPPCAGR